MNDCIKYSNGTLVTGGGTSVVPLGGYAAAQQGTIKQGVTIPADSFLQEVNGVLEPWNSLSNMPVAYSVSAIDTTAASGKTSVAVYFLPAKIQGNANLPSGLATDAASTKLKVAGAILTRNT